MNELLQTIQEQAEALDFAWALIEDQSKEIKALNRVIDTIGSNIRNINDSTDGLESTLEALL